ncbi:uncharacterized protein LOC142771803 isoform X2 [Rhipicephalus microplus]|uniref:uncharacterized protein LOC142771803 isoform X2 n=1 Tax=Rhipicephalus microplus TaxID=6941 RepID=UPI003F6C8339
MRGCRNTQTKLHLQDTLGFQTQKAHEDLTGSQPAQRQCPSRNSSIDGDASAAARATREPPTCDISGATPLHTLRRRVSPLPPSSALYRRWN